MENTKIKLTARHLILAIFYMLLAPVLILALAGDWRWPAGWIFNIWLTTESITILIYLYRKDPALLAERFQKTR